MTWHTAKGKGAVGDPGCTCPDSYATTHEGNPQGHYVDCPLWGVAPGESQRYMGELPMPSAAISVQTCAKCGAGEPMIRYHNDASREHGCGWYATARVHEPHLHFTCRTCLHEWTGEPLDAPASSSQPEEAT